MRLGGLIALSCACGGAPVQPRELPDARTAGAAACEGPPMDQLYAGAWPPNPWAPALLAAPCMTQPHDAIIVLGCPSAADGGASDCQVKRAEIASRLIAQGYAASAIVSGAAAHNAYVEAEALATLLIARGV